jgi:hypothetical protein
LFKRISLKLNVVVAVTAVVTAVVIVAVIVLAMIVVTISNIKNKKQGEEFWFII